MNQTCYLVAIINTGTLQVECIGLFSEDSPTIGSKRRAAVLASCTAEDYQQAYDEMRATLEHPFWTWAQPLLSERDRRTA